MNASKEKRIKVPLKFWDKIIELISLILLVILWFLTWNFHKIGMERVPEGYNFFKNPSEYWASNMTFSLPVIATGLYIVLTYVNSTPLRVEYVVDENPEKKERLQLINSRLLRWLKANLILIFIMIEVFSFETGANTGNGVPYTFLILFPLLLFGPIVYFFIEFSKNQLD